jgi:hypothetical protein
MQPVAGGEAAQQGADFQLGRGVAGFDRAHDGGALGGGFRQR